MYKRGIDVAHWEPEVDWAKVKAAGYDFAFIKASQGTVPDPKFATHWPNSRDILPRGPYHFYDPRYTVATPKAQANKFWELIKSDPGELEPVLDIERYTTGPYHGSSFWYDFLQYFHDLCGVYPMIYTGYYFWTDNVRIKPVTNVEWFAQNCKLWIANYDVPSPRIPKPWTDWEYWQYSESGMVDGVYDELGRLTECDLDFAKVTITEVNMWYLVQVSATSKLNIRDGAGLNYTDIGDLFRGDRVEVIAPALGDWVKIERVLRVDGTTEIIPNGWCSNAWLVPTTPPTLPTDDYMLHVKDGVTTKYVREA